MKTISKTMSKELTFDLEGHVDKNLTHNLNCERPVVSIWQGGVNITALIAISEHPTDSRNKIVINSASPLLGCKARVIGL